MAHLRPPVPYNPEDDPRKLNNLSSISTCKDDFLSSIASPRDHYLAQRSAERRQGIPGYVDPGGYHQKVGPLSPRAFPKSAAHPNGFDRDLERRQQEAETQMQNMQVQQQQQQQHQQQHQQQYRHEQEQHYRDDHDSMQAPQQPHREIYQGAMLSKDEYMAVEDALNTRFADMRKAFQYVDLDGSGTLDRAEIARALDLWGVPMDNRKLDALMAMCDTTGEGEISYEEFVHALARDRAFRTELANQEGKKRVKASKEEKSAAEILHDAQEGLNMRFGDMRKAFQYVDLDHSGTLDRSEIERALHMWNVPITAEKLDQLWDTLDVNSNGEISYAEFVNALARDTAGQKIDPAGPAATQLTKEQRETKQALRQAEDAVSSKFTDMRKAFQYVDLDHSGTVNRSELERALQMWNIQMPPEKLDVLWDEIDYNRNGEISYAEFVDALARDAVGKRWSGAAEEGLQIQPRSQTPSTRAPTPPAPPTLRELRLQEKAFQRQQRLAEQMVQRIGGPGGYGRR